MAIGVPTDADATRAASRYHFASINLARSELTLWAAIAVVRERQQVFTSRAAPSRSRNSSYLSLWIAYESRNS